jgi:hypothetical protein
VVTLADLWFPPVVRLEPILIMAALFVAPIIAKEISHGRAITD